jgi:hypothetical protein
MAKLTEKNMKKQIIKLNKDVKNGKITKKAFLEKQIYLMEYALNNFELSKIKKAYITKALNLCRITKNFL